MFAEKEEQSILFDKQKEIFYYDVAERTGWIEILLNNIKFENLIYHFQGLTKDKDFNDFIDYPFDDIKSKKDLKM